MQVDCNSSAHLLSVSAYRPGPVELAVEVMAPFGKVKDTRLALMVPTINMLGGLCCVLRGISGFDALLRCSRLGV